MSGAESVEARLQGIVDFCRDRITRTDVDTGETRSADAAANESSADTLARRRGTGDDLVDLMVAMAQANGLDARVALTPSRAEIFHQPRYTQRFFLRNRIVAIRDGATWRFLDPDNAYEPTARLRWQFERQRAIITDSDAPMFAQTPAAPADWSAKNGTVTLRLAADGTAEGDVRVEYSGHFATRYKQKEDSDTPLERERAVKDQMTAQWPGADVSAIRVENVTDQRKPYVNAYHVRIPGFAQRAGSRLLVQPALLERGRAPRFSSNERKYPISFDFAWSESEVATIELPDGFEMEGANVPPEVTFGEIGRHRVSLARGEGRTIVFTRRFSMGGAPPLLFNVSAYGALKTFFDSVARADGFALTLRPSTE